MRIGNDQIRPGDNLVFKRGTWGIASLLSLLIKVFYPRWDRWGWHMAVVVAYDNIDKNWLVLEAAWPRVRINRLSRMGEFRAYRWLDEQPPPDRVERFVDEHVGCRYDIPVYVLTFLAFLTRRIGFDFPRVIDRGYTCWELVYCFDDEMGKDISSDYNYPMITDFLEGVDQNGLLR